MFDLARIEARRCEHSRRIAHTERHPSIAPRGRRQPVELRLWSTSTVFPVRPPALPVRPELWTTIRRYAAFALVRSGARILGVQNDACHGTGRIVRQSITGPTADGLDHPVRVGLGPDGALYITYPAAWPGTSERQGALLRIDLSTMR